MLSTKTCLVSHAQLNRVHSIAVMASAKKLKFKNFNLYLVEMYTGFTYFFYSDNNYFVSNYLLQYILLNYYQFTSIN